MSSFSGLPPQGNPLTNGSYATLDWYRYWIEAYQYSGLAKAQFPLWQDCVVPALSMRADTAAPGLETFQGNLKAYSFDASTDEALLFTLQLPHGYTAGQDLAPFVQWAPSTTDSGNVVWVLEYAWASIDATFPSATTLSTTDAADGTARKHQVATFASDITGITSGVNKQVSSVLHCRISRNADDAADTYGADAFLLSVGVHFQNSGHGTPKKYP